MAKPRVDRAALGLSLLAMLAIWAAAAALAQDPVRLPTPWRVADVLWSEAQSGDLLRHVLATLTRVAWAFGLAMVVGAALGLLLGTRPRLDRWADAWVVIALNLPALVVIVLAYIWFGLNEVSAIGAVAFNKVALVLVTMREGARALDPAVAGMAKVFRLTPWQRLRHVLLPQLAPYLAASARNGLAIIWKLVLVVEFLGRPNGVGFQIHLHFQLFDVATVLAYSAAFVAVMLLVEYALLQPVEGRARRWRTA
ncbi:ABC transporter permease [Rubellimicrobium aerolatum]|uniref:ABC transporter permease n=1 Tax=Rubellimicrobium aerolatum TaxID=490979 RepID=A0ABW0S9C4_9RHOB|nr:ABC transporter permease [Rubellimicrobium aerolatum]MBP1804854.1 NitT/TauT family transport system permease protein [Rubellimicrobium aerolatum]